MNLKANKAIWAGWAGSAQYQLTGSEIFNQLWEQVFRGATHQSVWICLSSAKNILTWSENRSVLEISRLSVVCLSWKSEKSWERNEHFECMRKLVKTWLLCRSLLISCECTSKFYNFFARMEKITCKIDWIPKTTKFWTNVRSCDVLLSIHFWISFPENRYIYIYIYTYIEPEFVKKVKVKDLSWIAKIWKNVEKETKFLNVFDFQPTHRNTRQEYENLWKHTASLLISCECAWHFYKFVCGNGKDYLSN